MAKRYDAVVIGGGHNGLVNAAYLAKAGLKVLVLERRHLLGGATLTEEIVPGFKFSVFSYVVSLLRPEIIRELELPKHGLEILPLDGTITPLDDDYLWRVNDHGKTVRELRRWSLNDAEAYEEYGPADGRDGPVHQADPVGAAAGPREDLADGVAAPDAAREAVPRPSSAHADRLHPADDDVGGRLPRSVVRDRAPQSHDERLGDHRHLPGAALTRHRLRAVAPLHGRDRRRVPRVGRSQGRHRRDRLRDRGGGARRRRRDPHRGGRVADQDDGRQGDGRGPRVRRGDRGATS